MRFVALSLSDALTFPLNIIVKATAMFPPGTTLITSRPLRRSGHGSRSKQPMSNAVSGRTRKLMSRLTTSSRKSINLINSRS